MTYVTLYPHDPVWFDRFERERERIGTTVPDMLDVFHIGSTAIPDLPSKTTLDAVAVFEDAETMATARDALYDDGFGPHRDDPDWIVVTRSGGEYDVCLHLRPRKHDTWCDQIVFREYLRGNVRARARYERAKRAAAATHPGDVDAYVDAKESGILSLVREAYDRGYDERLPDYASRGQ